MKRWRAIRGLGGFSDSGLGAAIYPVCLVCGRRFEGWATEAPVPLRHIRCLLRWPRFKREAERRYDEYHRAHFSDTNI